MQRLLAVQGPIFQIAPVDPKLTDKEAMDIIKGRYDELTEYVLRLVFG